MIRLPVLILGAVAALAPAPAAAQAPAASPDRQLDVLLRQDAALRERIAQMQLDQLVARVDRSIGHRAAVKADPTLNRDFDRYTF